MMLPTSEETDPSPKEGCLCPMLYGCGRTGNILFQIAAVYAHALRVGSRCCVPWGMNTTTRELQKFLGERALPEAGRGEPIVYREPHFSYSPIPEDVKEGGIRGYFQSSKYFTDFEAEIREMFSPLVAPRQPGTLGIHIRMGDYLAPQNRFYQILTTPYLRRALQQTNAHHIVLFSDEPSRAEKVLREALPCPGTNEYTLEIDHSSPCEALRKMTSMDELIISASSFSWWGAWLGKPRKVIVPDEWYRHTIMDYQDIYEPSWTKLPMQEPLPPINVAILHICLGKYDIFWKDFYTTYEQNFLPREKKHYYVITDSEQLAWGENNNVTIVPWEKRGWPKDTMLRFEAFLSLQHELMAYDYVFWANANTRCIARVGREILPNEDNGGLTCVKHPYYALGCPTKYTYERNSNSTAYIPMGEGKAYVAGGFYGGTPGAFLKLCHCCYDNQQEDAKRGIIAVWHDESHLNKYILTKTPLILPDAYMWPEELGRRSDTRILVLDKRKWGGHSFLRS